MYEKTLAEGRSAKLASEEFDPALNVPASKICHPPARDGSDNLPRMRVCPPLIPSCGISSTKAVLDLRKSVFTEPDVVTETSVDREVACIAPISAQRYPPTPRIWIRRCGGRPTRTSRF